MTRATKFYLLMIVVSTGTFFYIASRLGTPLKAVELESFKWGIFFLGFSQLCAVLGIIAEFVFSDLEKKIKGD